MTALCVIALIVLLVLLVRQKSPRTKKEFEHVAYIARRCAEQRLSEKATERYAIDAAIAYYRSSQYDYTKDDIDVFVEAVLTEFLRENGF